MATELYSKLFLGPKVDDLESFEDAFATVAELFPIDGKMASGNKRMQAAQRIRALMEKKAIADEFAVEVMDFLYHVDDEELDRIAF